MEVANFLLALASLMVQIIYLAKADADKKQQ